MGGLSGEIWQPVRLTIELAAITTVILLIVGTPIAWWLARSKAWWKEGVASIVALPLVLPPTVLGFYLLVVLGPDGPGGLLASLWGGRTIAFTFQGLVIGSVLYSMPFVVQPIRNSFAAGGVDFPAAKVRRWINIYDPLDPVAAADPKLAGNFREVDGKRVEDIKESNWGSWRHTSTHYFAGTQFRRLLRESIGIS
jgi:hypothetical protein